MAEESIVYCIDSDVVINVGRHYRRDRFPTIWVHLERMVEDGRLIAPDEVRREIERGDDPLVDWVKNQRGLFVPVSNDLVAELRRVEEMFPELIDHMKVGPHADALIVALALLINKEPGTLFERRRCIVATNEKGRGQQKIPTACKHFGIEVVDWFGFMELEELEL